MPMPSRILRYSGSERPACRMNQTGRVRHGQAPAGPDERRIGRGGVVTRDMVPRRPNRAPCGAAIDDGPR